VKRKKQTTLIKKDNDITDIVDSDIVDEVVAEIISTSNSKRKDKFILLWLLGHSAKSAALSAGYSASYSASGIQRALKHSNSLRERIEKITAVMPERYRALCRLRLGDIAEIESEVLKKMKDSPEKAMKHPQLLRQLKVAAGVIGDDNMPVQQTYNIGQVQALILQGLQSENNKEIEGL